MAKQKQISHSEIISNYMNYVLENNTPPKSVYIFAKANNFEESEFYTYFGSFEAVENKILNTFFTNTLEVLNKNEDYLTFDSRSKLLSFYFTFFENLSANRSYLLLLLDNGTKNIQKLKVLSHLKNSFTQFISELNIDTLDFKEQKITKLQEKSIET